MFAICREPPPEDPTPAKCLNRLLSSEMRLSDSCDVAPAMATWLFSISMSWKMLFLETGWKQVGDLPAWSGRNTSSDASLPGVFLCPSAGASRRIASLARIRAEELRDESSDAAATFQNLPLRRRQRSEKMFSGFVATLAPKSQESAAPRCAPPR